MNQDAALSPSKSNQEADGETRPRLALLFPGQGAQHTGMGRRIAEASEAARQIFAQADEVLGVSISRLCFEGSEEELEDTVNTQPAILTASLAYLAYLRQRLHEVGRRLRPSLLAGHSLGEFTAAVAAESLGFSDGLRLVKERSRLMAEWARERPGGLATVLGLSDQAVEHICSEASSESEVGVAVFNTPGQTVISGEDDALERAMGLARERGGRVLRLPISVPSHIPLMESVRNELSRHIASLSFRDPQTPIVSNISAQLLTTAEEVRQELSDQICAAVQWVRCVATMASRGTATFVEVGPGRALSKMVRRIQGDDVQIFSVEHTAIDDLLAIGTSVPLDARETRRAGTRPDEIQIVP